MSRTLWGSWAQKPFSVPCFLSVGNWFQPPWPSLIPKGRYKGLLTREEEEHRVKGGAVKKQQRSLGSGPYFQIQGIYITILLSSLQTEPAPAQMEDDSVPHSRIKEPEELFRDKIASIHWTWKKQQSSRKTSISALWTMAKPLTVWITTNCGQFLKRWEYQTSWEICMQIKKQQLEQDRGKQPGSKSGKEYFKAVYYYPVYLTSMQSISC